MVKKTIKSSIQQLEDEEVLEMNLQKIQISEQAKPRRKLIKNQIFFEVEIPMPLKERRREIQEEHKKV